MGAMEVLAFIGFMWVITIIIKTFNEQERDEKNTNKIHCRN